MLLSAQLFGLHVAPLGYVIQGTDIVGISQAGESLNLNIPFLNSLRFSRVIGCEADGEAYELSASASSAFISAGNDKYKMDSVACGGSSYYMAGFNTVLYAYSRFIASGADEMSAVSAYTLPSELPTDKEMGKTVELALGAYRAECEFEICDNAPTVEKGDAPAFSFHTLTKLSANTPSSKFAGRNSKIYYLEPLYAPNGLPIFDDLKSMHKYVKELISRGAVLSICPTTDNMEQSLAKMSADVKPVQSVMQMPKAHFGGFIIESNRDIEGILIASTDAQTAENSVLYN